MRTSFVCDSRVRIRNLRLIRLCAEWQHLLVNYAHTSSYSGALNVLQTQWAHNQRLN